MTTQQHLDWLLYLMEENPEGWKNQCWYRAKEIAKDPAHAQLPEMLKAAMLSQSKLEAIITNPSPSSPLSSS